MTLIEGIGDEVTHFFIALFVIIIVTLAWWTTNISDQRHVRTVLLLDRRRHRAHLRLTNHTETVTIAEGTIIASLNDASPNIEEVPSIEPSSSAPKPPEASTSGAAVNKTSTDNDVDGEPELGEEQNIIETMDSDACVLRQRRLAFYDNFNNERRSETPQPSAPPPDLPQSSSNIDVPDSNDHTLMEHNYAERDENASANPNSVTTDHTLKQNHSVPVGDKTGITIKLKYINDDLKVVDGRLEELLGDFKKRHFQTELSANKLIRLIFNGQVLQPDTQTLKTCGLFDNCVVHCLIHQKRPQQGEASATESRRDGYSIPTVNGLPNLNNNNQNRDWDLGNFLFAFISFILLAAWYFRYVYAHLYTVTATVGLFLITGIFTIVLVGMYFPDNEHLPNPTIHIARERVQPQQ